MRIITMEEHYGHAGISKAGEENLKKLVPDFAAAFGNRRTFELLFDFDNERIKTMDEDHISVQVDYPYVSTKEAESFILNSSLSEEEKEKFAHLNAEKLLKLR